MASNAENVSIGWRHHESFRITGPSKGPVMRGFGVTKRRVAGDLRCHDADVMSLYSTMLIYIQTLNDAEPWAVTVLEYKVNCVFSFGHSFPDIIQNTEHVIDRFHKGYSRTCPLFILKANIFISNLKRHSCTSRTIKWIISECHYCPQEISTCNSHSH